MSKPNSAEADMFRKGLATVAQQDGASAGDVVTVSAEGELEMNAPGGDSPFLVVEKTLLAADISALHTGFALMPNPASDKIAAPVQITTRFTPGASPYTDPGGFFLTASDAGDQWYQRASGWDVLGGAGNAETFLVNTYFEFVDSTVFAAGLPLTISTDNSPTGGDGSLHVAVVYRLT